MNPEKSQCSEDFRSYYINGVTRIFEIVITYGLVLAAGAAWRSLIEDITIPIFSYHKKSVQGKLIYALFLTAFTVLLTINSWKKSTKS